MKIHHLVIGILLTGLLSFNTQGETAPLDLHFSPEERADWNLEQRVPEKPSLVFTPRGLDFTSEGFDLIEREWPIGTAPFELSVDLEMTKGRAETSARSRGIVIALSSAPSTSTSPEDTTIFLAVTQTGLVLYASKGGSRLGIEDKPGVWQLPSGNILGGRFATSMAGAGGQEFSVRWPTKVIAGTKLRFWCSRDAEGNMNFKLFNADGAAAPWWEATVPGALAQTNFRYLTIHTGREAADFANLSTIKLPDGQGNGPADGIITRLQAREASNGKMVLDESFPAAVHASSREAKSLLLDQKALQALRKKFNSPAFANYKTMILRQAASEELAKLQPGQANQNEATFALTWALLLTEDKKTYLEPLLQQVDALIGPSEIYPKNEFEWPGQLRQLLFIKEFWVQNLVSLALAYDLVGNDLGPERRARIRFLLTRMMKSYHELLDDGDWWFGQNPSNTIGVGNGALGVIAVVMREDQPELSQKTIARARDNIRKLFTGVEADGGCLEGPMYWNYGLGYPMLFGWTLRQTTGSDEGMLSSPQVKNAPAYLAVNFGGDGKMVPFNDSQPWLIGWPVLAAAGTEDNNSLARWMADHMAAVYASGATSPEQARSTYTIPAFLYRDTVAAPKIFPGLPTLATLESIQEGIMRSSGKELKPALATAVKGKGINSTHHANEDQGSFVFYADGEMLLLDPGYFEDKAQLHSLPLLGEVEKMKLDPKKAAPLSDIWEESSLRSMTVDATDAYNSRDTIAERARRIFLQVGNEGLIILDDTVPRDPSTAVTAQYQAAVPVTVDKATARLAGSKSPVRIHLFGPTTLLTSTPQEFSKDWIYKSMGVKWTTLRASYTANPNRPLVTVITREAAIKEAPRVEYRPNEIIVRLGRQNPLRFIKSPQGWKTEQKPRSQQLQHFEKQSL